MTRLPLPGPADDPPARRVRRLCGAPAERRAALLAWRRASPPHEVVWWLVETPAAAAAIRRELPGADNPGLLAPGVMTVRQAAGERVSGVPRLPLTPAARLGLLGDLATAAGFRDALGPLAPLAGSAGLVEFLASRFRMLRRDGVAPSQASAKLRALDGAEAGGVLARLYRDYVEAIHQGDLLDDEEAVVVATTLVEASSAPRRLAIDLPTAPSPIEQRFIEALVTRADEVILCEAGPHLGTPAGGALAELGGDEPPWWSAWGSTAEPWRAPERPVAPGLAELRRTLFDDASPHAADPEGVAVVAGGSHHDTARRLARRVKRLIVAGETPPEIVVALPALDQQAPRYVEALREYGIPTATDAAPRLGTAPLARLLVDLLEVAEGDWQFEPVCRLIAHRRTPALDTRGGEGFPPGRAATEWLLRELQVPSGRRYLLRQIRQLADRPDATGRADRLGGAARLARPGLEALDAACELLGGEATPLAWLDASDAALRLLGHAGIGPAADPADRRAADALEEAAASLETLARWRGREPRAITLRDWLATVRGWATRLRLPSDGGAEGRVRVVGLATAGGLACRHLFVGAAGEDAFRPVEGPSPADAMRQFHEIVATPSASLTLAYAALDDAAQPLSPSPMLVEVERRFAAGVLRAGEAPPLAGPISTGAPLSRREARLAAVAGAIGGDATLLRSVCSTHAASLGDALRAVAARGTGGDFGPWEGVVAGEAARAKLAERFGAPHLWSASQLETLAECPYQFFARHVLRLEPVGELRLGVNYRRRGLVMHEALSRCLADAAAELPTGERLSAIPPEELTERLVERVREQAAAGNLPPHEAALVAIEVRQAEGWALLYAEQQAKYDGSDRLGGHAVAMRPALLEARFGPSKGEQDPTEDKASTDTPLELILPGGEAILVGGRIDRIDVGRLGRATFFTIIDYKTAKDYRFKLADVLSGKRLQPVLYAIAAQRLLLPEGAIPVAAGYWAVRGRGFVGPEARDLPMVEFDDGEPRPSEAWRETVDAVIARCGELVSAARGGGFPMNNADEHCGRSCDFRTVCRVGQARAMGKAISADSEGEDD